MDDHTLWRSCVSNRGAAVSGHDAVLGAVWAMRHLTLARLRREVPGITYTGASVVTDRVDDVECILCVTFKQ